MPTWLIRAAPYIGAILGAALLYLWAEGNGVDKERAKWQKKEVAAQEAQRAREAMWQAQIDAAGVALSMRSAELERLANLARQSTRTFYVENPDRNVSCLGPDRLRHIAESDAAAQAATQAPK